MLVFFILMTIAIQNQLLSARQEQNVIAANQLADLINKELILAEQVNKGYQRELFLPADLNGLPYTLQSSPDGYDLVIDYANRQYVYFVDGNLSKLRPLAPGRNILKNT